MSGVAKKKAARAVADLGQGTILANVEIAAPVERVFQAITDSTEIVRWWGSSDTYQTEKWTADLRVGGRWRADGRGADGAPFSVEGEFLEIDPPHKLVQTWKPEWDGGNVTTITYRLESIPGGTRLTLRHEGFAGRPESCMGHTEGWEGVLSWLQGYVEPSAPPQPKQFFLCRLLPPRPSFMQDMNAAELKVMQEHAAYWTELSRKGTAVLFGPVADPKGGWGVGVLEVRSEAELRELQSNDPAIRSGFGLSYETLPMLKAVLRP